MFNCLLKLLNLSLFVLIILIFVLDHRSFNRLHNFLISKFDLTNFDKMSSIDTSETAASSTGKTYTIDDLAEVDISSIGRFKYSKFFSSTRTVLVNQMMMIID